LSGGFRTGCLHDQRKNAHSLDAGGMTLMCSFYLSPSFVSIFLGGGDFLLFPSFGGDRLESSRNPCPPGRRQLFPQHPSFSAVLRHDPSSRRGLPFLVLDPRLISITSFSSSTWGSFFSTASVTPWGRSLAGKNLFLEVVGEAVFENVGLGLLAPSQSVKTQCRHTLGRPLGPFLWSTLVRSWPWGNWP